MLTKHQAVLAPTGNLLSQSLTPTQKSLLLPPPPRCIHARICISAHKKPGRGTSIHTGESIQYPTDYGCLLFFCM